MTMMLLRTPSILCVLALATACGGGGGATIPPTPARPTALQASATDPTTVRLGWQDNDSTETGYEIERAEGTQPFAALTRVGADVTSHADAVLPRRTYRYRVRAVHPDVNSAFSEEASVTPPLPPPPTIANLSPSSVFEPQTPRITISGTGFTVFDPGAPIVLFGGAPAAAITVLDDHTLSCRVPTGAGTVDVAVGNFNGTAIASGGFRHFQWPTIADAEHRLDSDSPGTSASTSPQVSSAAESVFVVWSDSRSGLSDEDIHFNRSDDHGASWLPADVRIDTDGASGGRSLAPRICCDGDSVYVVWEHFSSGDKDIRFNRSLDGGRTWLPSDLRIDTDATGTATSASPRIACSGSLVYIAWEDDRSGSSEVRFNRSDDSGLTWLGADLQVPARVLGSGEGHTPEICCSGARVFVTWQDTRSGLADIYANASTDGGLTWRATDSRLDTDLAGAAISVRPQICSESGEVHVVWEDLRNGNADIYGNRSTDAGVTWGAGDQRLDTDAAGAAASHNPRIAAHKGNIYVVWEDARDGSVHLNRSADSGASWLSQDLRLDTSAPGPDSDAPAICCDGQDVFVAWDRGDNNTCDIYLNSSRDSGVTWQNSVVRIDDAASNGDSDDVALCCAGAQAYMVYADSRNGEDDVYFNRNRPN